MGVATPGAVAARERVQPPTVTRVLNALDEAGLVMREPHPDDGRQVLISVSELGEQILTRERDRRDEWLAAQLGSLTTDERALLTGAAAVLERIATE
jgi:DNA-binding MarR family transcriptional regulator